MLTLNDPHPKSRRATLTRITLTCITLTTHQVSSGTFRSGILLQLCRAQSGMQLHERALESCDQAVAQRQPTQTGGPLNTAGLVEALKVRSQAHQGDHNHDDAVSDLRRVAELLGGQDKQEAEMALRRAQQQQQQWNENRDYRQVSFGCCLVLFSSCCFLFNSPSLISLAGLLLIALITQSP